MAAWTGVTTKELITRPGHSTPDASLRYQHAARTRYGEIAATLEVFARESPASVAATSDCVCAPGGAA